MTATTERVIDFLASTESIEHDTAADVAALTEEYFKKISESIYELEEVSYIDVFHIANPGKDETREYAKFCAWHEHLRAEGAELTTAYYEAVPYSPYYGSEEDFDELIACGQREESDKDIWSITFKHPVRPHFYIAKYIPGKGGRGFGYRVSVSNNFEAYYSTLRSIADGQRYFGRVN